MEQPVVPWLGAQAVNIIDGDPGPETYCIAMARLTRTNKTAWNDQEEYGHDGEGNRPYGEGNCPDGRPYRGGGSKLVPLVDIGCRTRSREAVATVKAFERDLLAGGSGNEGLMVTANSRQSAALASAGNPVEISG